MDTLFKFPALAQVLAEYADYITTTYKQNLEKSGHKATGKLISSVHTVVNIGDFNASVDMYLEDYYKYVEKGRNEGSFPPVNKILEWIRIKPIIPRPDSNGKVPTEQQLAYLIGRNMMEKGSPTQNGLPTPPTFDLRHAKETADSSYISRIEQAIQEDLSNELTSVVSMLIV